VRAIGEGEAGKRSVRAERRTTLAARGRELPEGRLVAVISGEPALGPSHSTRTNPYAPRALSIAAATLLASVELATLAPLMNIVGVPLTNTSAPRAMSASTALA
jgi:hypothetical protein